MGSASGFTIGGLIGGISAKLQGGDFVDGFADGSMWGAISGALSGVLGVATAGSSFIVSRSVDGLGDMMVYIAQTKSEGDDIKLKDLFISWVTGAALSTSGSKSKLKAAKSAASHSANEELAEQAEKSLLNSAKKTEKTLVTDAAEGAETAVKNKLLKETGDGVSKGGRYSGDLMSPEEAARYNEYWCKQGVGSDKTYKEFTVNNPGKDINDYFKLIKEQSPWPDGYVPIDNMVTLKSGDTFYMVLDSKQKISSPGGFAIKENVPSVEFARNDMAIKYGWKEDCGKVVKYRVKDGVELTCPAGPIGPQIDLGADVYLPGNLSLTQYDLFNGLGRINRNNYIEFVPGSTKRLK